MNLKHISMPHLVKIQFTATLPPLLRVPSCPLTSDLSSKVFCMCLTCKVNYSLSTPRRRIEGAEAQLRSFLTSQLYEGEGLRSRPGRFIPREEPRYQMNWNLCVSKKRSRPSEEEKNHLPLLGFEPLTIQTRSSGKFQTSSNWVRQAYMLVRM
jgi:hypothetical protein